MMNELQQLKAKREALDKQIAEMEAEGWPKEGDLYWYTESSGLICSSFHCNHIVDFNRIAHGVSRTEDQERYYRKYFKLLREIDAFCEERNPDGWDWREGGSVFGIDFNRSGAFLEVSRWESAAATMYGKLKERPHAVELLEKFGDRIMEVINFKK